jgi:hypothetical protein
MKKHYIGAVYDVNQANMQNLINQLDETLLTNTRIESQIRLYKELSRKLASLNADYTEENEKLLTKCSALQAKYDLLLKQLMGFE